MTQSQLGSCAEPLSAHYDVALLDLDGVVYLGPDVVPGVVPALAEARAAGMRTAFATNNAARTASSVADHLRSLGLVVAVEDVVTSAQAVASMMAEELPPGAGVFVIGGEGLLVALAEVGLTPTQDPEARVGAVVSGYHPDLRFRTVVDGTILLRSGLPWYASNADLTLPTPRGIGPGNGALIDLVARVVQRRPRVAGKPEPDLFRQSAARTSARRPLVVGDRLDTDIEGARRAEMDSLLVLTGVTGLAELVSAQDRPAPDLRQPHPGGSEPRPRAGGTRVGSRALRRVGGPGDRRQAPCHRRWLRRRLVASRGFCRMASSGQQR